MADESKFTAFYAVIPGWILHCESLSASAKLFYGELSVRCGEDGYCWETNGALAHELNCGERTVTRLVGELEKAGAIHTELLPTNEKKGNRERRIRLKDSPAFGVAKIGETAKNGETGVAKNGETLYRMDNINNPPISPQGECDVAFDRFWARYPRKQDKQKARRAWKKLRPDETLFDAMLAALERQISCDQWRRGYIPLPSTWLNGRRWEDVMPDGISPHNSPELSAPKRYVRTDVIDGTEVDIFE